MSISRTYPHQMFEPCPHNTPIGDQELLGGPEGQIEVARHPERSRRQSGCAAWGAGGPLKMAISPAKYGDFTGKIQIDMDLVVQKMWI